MPHYESVYSLEIARRTFEDHPIYLFARDAKSTLTPNETQRNTLIVAACYILVIAILWHVPYISFIIYPFKLLTVGFHEMSHAFMGVLTCAHIHSIELDPDEGGATRMSGGIPWLTLPAGYLGSSFIGACLIACGFNTNASKVASLVLAVFFVFTLWWARRNWITWVLILGMSGLTVMFWFVGGGVALRYFVLFIGVMSCMYVLWDVIDDTISRKVNGSDAYSFSEICGCCPSQVWGVIWLLVAFAFFAGGILVGLAAFKQSAAQQATDASHFIPVPGSHSSASKILSTEASSLSILAATTSTLLVIVQAW
ncbi:Peptidase M50B-like-domain-containing protein [Abortiporus biennis]